MTSKRTCDGNMDGNCKRRKRDEEDTRSNEILSTSGLRTEELDDMLVLVRVAWQHVSILVLLLLLGVAALVAISSSMETVSAFGWMLLSAFGCLLWACKAAYRKIVSIVETTCYVSLHVRGAGSNPYFVQAFGDTLRKVGLRGDANVEVENAKDEVTGAAVYKLVLLPNSLKCSLVVTKGESSHEVQVRSMHSDAVVCGPKNELQYPTDYHVYCQATSIALFFSLPLRWNRRKEVVKLVSKQKDVMSFLQEWLGAMYSDYMRVAVGMVEVMQLQKESTEWAPEWHEIRKEHAVNRSRTSSESPSSHYSVQPWATRMLRHAEFGVKQQGRSRTCLFVHGSKGSGKTLFVEWLASELGLPIYYIDLHADFITDTVLRDAITPKKLRHNLPVIFHVDEFQSMIEAWADHADERTEKANQPKITIEGLQSVLEGIATPNHALFVFTGSRAVPDLKEIKNETLRHEWEGLLRRLSVREMIPVVGKDSVAEFYTSYLSPYLPSGADLGRIRGKCRVLVESWCVESTPVPFDMLGKYAEQQLRHAYVKGLLVAGGPGMHMRVPAEKFEDFVSVFFNTEMLGKWPCTYVGGARLQSEG